MITVIFLSTMVFSLAKAEFQILNHQRVSPWIAYYTTDADDCEKEKLEQLPHIYGTQNASSISIGPPLNFTVDSFNREAFELGGEKNFFYPGATISFYPPQYGFDSVTGYDLLLRRNGRYDCVVMDFTNTLWSQEERIEIELFPLHGLVHYELTVSSLPQYNETFQSGTLDFVTGQYAKYRNVDRSLPPPANWYADVAYDIITASGNDTANSVEIVFSKPPVQYNFELFEITLVPKDGGSNVRKEKTTKLFHVFENVPAGKYKVMIKPVDEFFSHAGRCLCRLADGACSNCISAIMEAVVP